MSRLLMQVFTSPLTWLVFSESARIVKTELVKVKRKEGLSLIVKAKSGLF